MTKEQQYWENTQEALSRIFDRCEEIDPQSGYDMLEDIQFVRGFINKHKPQECNLYGTTGTDHCEHDCVCRALDIIDKYQKIKQIYENWNEVNDFSYNQAMQKIGEVLEDGNGDR